MQWQGGLTRTALSWLAIGALYGAKSLVLRLYICTSMQEPARWSICPCDNTGFDSGDHLGIRPRATSCLKGSRQIH
jgi:hypothetical protein